MSSMSCDQIRERLSAYQDRELPSEEQAQVERHLATCASCARELAALAGLGRDLAVALEPGPPSHDELAARVIRGLHAPRARRRVPLALPVALAAAAGFLIAYLIFGHRAPSGPESDSRAALAHLTVATGPVEVRSRGETTWHALATGGGVERGSAVRTPLAVKCALVLRDGTELRVNGGTEVELAEARQLELRGGRIFTILRAFVMIRHSRIPRSGPRAASKAWAIWSTPQSSRWRATICRPIGSPSVVNPHGTEMAGLPTAEMK